MSLIEVADFSSRGWAAHVEAPERSRRYCERLEQGDILFFQQTPFPLSEPHRTFLLDVRQHNTAHHKNISYRPGRTRVAGFKKGSTDATTLLSIMDAYSKSVVDFARRFLLPYAGAWQVDFASFRPIEEQGRDLPVRKRNDLLHVDSFPTRPSNGNRILRVFTNLNPAEPRIWLTSDPFDVLVRQYGNSAGLSALAARQRSISRSAGRRVRRIGAALGLPVVDRPLYDDFMLRFHHALKSSREFQEGCPKSRWEFPPDSAWLVFTDMVPHAVLSGRFALEQTLLLSREALLVPAKAPYRVLEELSGVPLTD